MKIQKFTRIILIVTFLFFMGCGKETNQTTVKGAVKDAYFNWIHQVETSRGYTEGVVSLYANNAILLPTLSPKMCTTKQMLVDYFVKFLSLKNMQIETKQLITRIYGDIAMNTGFYDVSYYDGNKREVVKARFDFWYKEIDGEWKIIFHQSSIIPD